MAADLASHGHRGWLGGARGAEIPDDAKRCMAEHKLWLAAPELFEKVQIPRPDGHSELGFEILDRFDGRLGHILLFPERCRVVVLSEAPAKGPRQTVDISAFKEAPTDKQRELLWRWTGTKALDRAEPPHAAESLLATLDATSDQPWIAVNVSGRSIRRRSRTTPGPTAIAEQRSAWVATAEPDHYRRYAPIFGASAPPEWRVEGALPGAQKVETLALRLEDAPGEMALVLRDRSSRRPNPRVGVGVRGRSR